MRTTVRCPSHPHAHACAGTNAIAHTAMSAPWVPTPDLGRVIRAPSPSHGEPDSCRITTEWNELRSNIDSAKAVRFTGHARARRVRGEGQVRPQGAASPSRLLELLVALLQRVLQP